MANPTTNFGWVMPASTDLVTDLPADFAVFGDAVDSDLSTGGGYSTTATAAGTTTMTVSSNRTQFFTGSTTQTVVMPVASTLALGWHQRIVNNSSGVVTVQSSGANTSYAVPAGGDVIFTCILASGTTAASWDYKDYIVGPSAPTFVGCNIFKSAAQTISNTTWTAVSFNSELNDTSAFHDTVTNNSRITIPTGKGGYYQINAAGAWANSSAGDRYIAIYKNGVELYQSIKYNGTQGNAMSSIGNTLILNVAVADYLELYVYQSSGGNLDISGGNVFSTFLSVIYLGA